MVQGSAGLHTTSREVASWRSGSKQQTIAGSLSEQLERDPAPGPIVSGQASLSSSLDNVVAPAVTVVVAVVVVDDWHRPGFASQGSGGVVVVVVVLVVSMGGQSGFWAFLHSETGAQPTVFTPSTWREQQTYVALVSVQFSDTPVSPS